MNANQLKCKLLELFVRNVLFNCGFIYVKPDDLFIYENNGLFFINGKGAAHDADVLLEPPIQIPFTYPTRLLFECKAHGNIVGLSTIRNALGLRNDINDFEIVTTETLRRRKNNRRAEYAIEKRKRHHYQIGVAALNDFSKSAIEFAANNKIPLFSLSWIFQENLFIEFNKITDSVLREIPDDKLLAIKRILTNREYEIDRAIDAVIHGPLSNYQLKTTLEYILNQFEDFISNIYVGIIESGDLIFLFPPNSDQDDYFKSANIQNVRSEIYWAKPSKNIWTIKLQNNGNSQYNFHLPYSVIDEWKKENYNKSVALDIKQEYLNRIIVFNKSRMRNLPFIIINLDLQWLNEARRNLDL